MFCVILDNIFLKIQTEREGEGTREGGREGERERGGERWEGGGRELLMGETEKWSGS